MRVDKKEKKEKNGIDLDKGKSKYKSIIKFNS
jgi:hypothetical protein